LNINARCIAKDAPWTLQAIHFVISQIILGYDWIGITWMIPVFGLMFFGGLVLLFGDSVGYFKELVLDEDGITGRHLFGWKISIEYQIIRNISRR
jgi:hypothetical protein